MNIGQSFEQTIAGLYGSHYTCFENARFDERPDMYVKDANGNSIRYQIKGYDASIIIPESVRATDSLLDALQWYCEVVAAERFIIGLFNTTNKEAVAYVDIDKWDFLKLVSDCPAEWLRFTRASAENNFQPVIRIKCSKKKAVLFKLNNHKVISL